MLRYCAECSRPLTFCVNVRIILTVSTKRFAGILLGPCWFSGSLLEELTSSKYWLFLSMNMNYLSICLELVGDLSSKFTVSAYGICTYFVRLLPEYFTSWGSVITGLQSPSVHCWCIGKHLTYTN